MCPEKTTLPKNKRTFNRNSKKLSVPRSEAFRYGLGRLASDLAGKPFVVVCESIELGLDGLYNSLQSIRGFDSAEDALKEIHESRESLRSQVLSNYPTAREMFPSPSSEQRDLIFCAVSDEVSCVEQITFRLDQIDQFFAHSMFWDLLRFDASEQVVNRLYVAYGRSWEIERYIERLGAEVPVAVFATRPIDEDCAETILHDT